MSAPRVALLALVLLLLLPASALAATGGPDSYGYTWTDSNEAAGPTFDPAFVPASAAYGLCGDEWYTVPIGFLFDFYGNLYGQAVISANGVLYLANSSQNTPAGADAFNSCPIGAGAHPLIAPLWDDYYANSDLILCGGPSWTFASVVGTSTTGSAPYRVFKLSWVNNTLVSCGSGGGTFTIHLYEEDGSVELHYQDVSFGAVACDGGASASVGIADSGLASGSVLDVACDTASVSAGYAVRFDPPAAACGDGDVDGFDDEACGGDDCDDADPLVFPGATELCNGADDDCDGFTDEGFDPDGDGFGACTATADCWEGNASVFPGAVETADGVDEDCDGVVDEGTDAFDDDGDGWSEDGGDCDDGDPAVAPGLPEAFNSVDDDCDGDVDEGSATFDDDGDGSSEAQGDCDDSDPGVGPDVIEVAANGIDDDCDGTVDDQAAATDGDGDGFAAAVDCDDGDDDVHPGAPEQPNTVDDDCDGEIDEGTELSDDDGDGFTELDGDCADGDAGIHPGADELPDGVDEDCDGLVDEGTSASDDDGDGFTEDGGDCDDADPEVHPGVVEAADGVDQDCDGRVDEGTAAWDNDGDGLSGDDGDCDDTDPWVSPEAEEVCDGLDNDCDGDLDEGCSDDVVAPPVQDDGCSGSLAGRSALGGLGLLVLMVAVLRRRGAWLLAGVLLVGCTNDVVIHPGLGDLSLTPELLDFGPIPQWGEGSLTLQLDNTGTAALSIASMSVQDDADGAFSLDGETSIELERGQGAEVILTFTPSVAGLFTATLVINSDTGQTTRREVLLRGQGAEPSVQVWPLVLDFGLEPGPLPLTVASDGLVRVELSEMDLVGDAEAFALTLPAAVGQLPAEVDPGQELVIQVEFATLFAGPAEASLRLRTDDPLAPVVPVTLLGNVHCDSPSGLALDGDGDGFSACGGDCDDADPSAFPGATEYLDEDDNDCDGVVDEGTDAYDDDGDGVTELDGDCDDTDEQTYPGAPEVVDGVDDDCDGVIDDGTAELDDDGDGYAEIGGDCDDADPAVHPGALEVCDGVDDDCDGLIDDGTAGYDDDGDGATENEGDCHDGDPDIGPTEVETANGIDDDCDGDVDEDTGWADDDGDGFSEAGGDCDDADPGANPAAEEVTGNAVDDDCDGSAD